MFATIQHPFSYLKTEDLRFQHFMGQSRLWQRKTSNFEPTDIVLPLFVYFYDFKSNNHLRSHCSKVGGAYVTITCLPPEIASRLENIFLSILFNSVDRQDFGVKKIIAPLVIDLKLLEKEGIEVILSTGEKLRVYFVMDMLLVDNLEIHQICGFTCNSSSSNYPCHYCKVHLNRMQVDLQLDKSLLRNRQNYEEDVHLQDQELTGIKNRCDFNEIKSFHITENLEDDILHDFDEDISHYVMKFISIKLTGDKIGFFKLADLKRRLNLFDFGTNSALYRTKLYAGRVVRNLKLE